MTASSHRHFPIVAACMSISLTSALTTSIDSRCPHLPSVPINRLHGKEGPARGSQLSPSLHWGLRSAFDGAEAPLCVIYSSGSSEVDAAHSAWAAPWLLVHSISSPGLISPPHTWHLPLYLAFILKKLTPIQVIQLDRNYRSEIKVLGSGWLLYVISRD